jgi:hypothetical protein
MPGAPPRAPPFKANVAHGIHITGSIVQPKAREQPLFYAIWTVF